MCIFTPFDMPEYFQIHFFTEEKIRFLKSVWGTHRVKIKWKHHLSDTQIGIIIGNL